MFCELGRSSSPSPIFCSSSPLDVLVWVPGLRLSVMKDTTVWWFRSPSLRTHHGVSSVSVRLKFKTDTEDLGVKGVDILSLLYHG